MFKRITIKVGSNGLTRADGSLDVTRMSALVDQIAELRDMGTEVVLVSSGAVASGRSELKGIQCASSSGRKMDSVGQRQLYSAVGQAKLINRYYEMFRDHGISVRQVLTTKESLATRQDYLNQRNCMEVMLQCGVLPIVNENDTISVTELMFTDNDELSGLIATMTGAEALVILSNIDGIYTGSPSDPKSELIRTVEPGRDLSEYIQSEKSGFGRGGMLTKSRIASKMAEEGITVVIAHILVVQHQPSQLRRQSVVNNDIAVATLIEHRHKVPVTKICGTLHSKNTDIAYKAPLAYVIVGYITSTREPISTCP